MPRKDIGPNPKTCMPEYDMVTSFEKTQKKKYLVLDFGR